jgi:hypothetical protein
MSCQERMYRYSFVSAFDDVNLTSNSRNSFFSVATVKPSGSTTLDRYHP